MFRTEDSGSMSRDAGSRCLGLRLRARRRITKACGAIAYGNKVFIPSQPVS